MLRIKVKPMLCVLELPWDMRNFFMFVKLSSWVMDQIANTLSVQSQQLFSKMGGEIVDGLGLPDEYDLRLILHFPHITTEITSDPSALQTIVK